MTFEILDKDLAGRIGKLKTRRGIIETPYLFPVINPYDKTITVKDVEKLGFNAFITNILHVRRAVREFNVKDVHELLGFTGPIMTDSGAYQLLVYGHVEITPKEAIELQERHGSDIAVILDLPTGNISRSEASLRVNETIKRAKELMDIKSDNSILWVGPVQGAPYLDLAEYCAKQLSALEFDIYAIGSPTTIMESYQYDALLDLIYTVKRTLPIERPIHLFGAGHPMMLSLAVALGCDLFDSASYILYAKEHRYMTSYGTYKINELEYFPCSCPICSKYTPQEITEMTNSERVKLIALHNLYALMSEIKSIKQYIKEGTLWEYISLKSRSHPRLFSAFLRLRKYSVFLEKLDPATKPSISGLFFYDYIDAFRPKVKRYFKKITNCLNYLQNKVLVLLPKRSDNSHSKSFLGKLIKALGKLFLDGEVKLLFYDFPFCLTPIELNGFYPLSQYESPNNLDNMTKRFVSMKLINLLRKIKPRGVVLYNEITRWGHYIKRACEQACDYTKVLDIEKPYENPSDIERIKSLVHEILYYKE
ncbi:MAG: tRNA guanosine(15) transglycosylase TgtA [Thermoprotei archaeon]|nr:MAG: tRNA guanosine(15) transglycosylase TgtA [Thermoprotei archaeon]